ncbi:hypothetical protein BGW36DRAFT_408647 [Talaromyces proteolyticus]|uniref:Xylanolytic transcriptional activator regulatory domain-containing protein n=1 Tax=Talaromyces proteolyticus TaxID=1131652 RepID=A0AAD4PWD1_9EURO|nr:uncharacterized protein BGW36DRAFT_408647 [Talaromyces proteolyticus]KAH8694960.1 hypothetical protein BGW36DRAFT_408647 [Talaromyces proteolyticus]
MMALGARFSNNESFKAVDPRQRGEEFAARARKLLDLTNISVTTIQACILLGTICFSKSEMQSEALYYSIAVRLALILDLPHRHCDEEVERQVNLRIWCSLHMMDLWSSIGLSIPQQLDFVDGSPLPTNEETFLSLKIESRLNIDTNRRGLWSEMLILSRIWRRIHQVNTASVSGTIKPNSLIEAVDALAHELEAWASSLTPNLQENFENLEHYASIGLGNAFVALHLGYHYYHEVLFYQFLAKNDVLNNSGRSTERYQAHCEEHALAFCDLLYQCRALDRDTCQCRYVMVGHMLVITSTIYMHRLLFSENEATVSLVRQRLSQNFEILTDLQKFWAPLDVALSRLQVFHNACRKSIDESFRMDQWMLKFILEHGSSVVERALSQTSEPDTLYSWFSQTFQV